MAVPALPADVSAGGTTSASHQNTILDLIEWFRDTRPWFKGQPFVPASIATATNVELGFGSVASTFSTTPTRNIGSFTVSSSANADGYYNLQVPETGIYSGYWYIEYAANTTGIRRARGMHSSSVLAAASDVRDAMSSGVTWCVAPFEVDITAANQTLSCQVHQTSGGGLAISAAWLFVRWGQST